MHGYSVQSQFSRVFAVIATLGGLLAIASGCGDVPVILSGTVVDVDGIPVVGAVVRITDQNRYEAGVPSPTDESGRFEVQTTASSVGQTFRVAVDADGFLRKETTFKNSSGGNILKIQLDKEVK